ncbi:MAG: DNA alkylation repair protein [archaeon]
MSQKIAAKIRSALRQNSDQKQAASLKKYFKEPIKCYGLKVPQCRAVAKQFYPLVSGNIDLTIEVADRLLRSGFMEEAFVAVELLKRIARRLEPEHFSTIDRWVDYLTNWANTDDLSAHIIGDLITRHPDRIRKLVQWTSSPNLWRRRAAAVSLVLPARRGMFLKEVLAIADRLMDDQDDMVQKGVGWVLKEASVQHQQEIHQYLLKWKTKASALTLRYASEKLPKTKKVLKTK